MARTLPDITPEKLDAICQALEVGCSLDAAARAAGIAPRTIRNWRGEGKRLEKARIDLEEQGKTVEVTEREQLYLDAYIRMVEAGAKAANRNVQVIANAAAMGDWRAALEWLRRRRKNEWAAPERVEHSGPKGKAIQIASSVTLQEVQAAMKSALLNETLMAGHTNGKASTANGAHE